MRGSIFNNLLVSTILCVLQTVFPLVYLLLKRHYEIVRAMRTKVLDWRVLGPGVEGFINVKNAIRYRVNDLTCTSSSIYLAGSVSLTRSAHADIFSHQKLDPEKQFQNFAYGIVGYLIFCPTRVLSKSLYSSSISIMRKSYGLHAMSELSIHHWQLNHPTIQMKTRTKMPAKKIC